MNHNGIDTDILHHQYVSGKGLLQLVILHGMAAIFDHNGFIVKSLDVG